MKIRLIAFSARGAQTASRAAKTLIHDGHECRCFAPEGYCGETGAEPLDKTLHEWTKISMAQADALIFCCAAGIAVRGIAPFVKDKTSDPAVVVIDETGRFSIPILSGHLGGANELALCAAKAVGAQPVITTATDRNGLFAVDVFAKKNHLYITDMKMAKKVSAALVAGKNVGIASALTLPEQLPSGLCRTGAELGIWIGEESKQTPFSETLTLILQRTVVGIGCKRGKTCAELEEFLIRQAEANGVDLRSLRAVASIDVKKDEEGLLQLCRKYRVPFLAYPAQKLNDVPGDYSGSDFVKKTVGVDCVCERAVVCAGAQLTVKKVSHNGMTLAFGVCREEIQFE